MSSAPYEPLSSEAIAEIKPRSKLVEYAQGATMAAEKWEQDFYDLKHEMELVQVRQILVGIRNSYNAQLWPNCNLQQYKTIVRRRTILKGFENCPDLQLRTEVSEAWFGVSDLVRISEVSTFVGEIIGKGNLIAHPTGPQPSVEDALSMIERAAGDQEDRPYLDIMLRNLVSLRDELLFNTDARWRPPPRN